MPQPVEASVLGQAAGPPEQAVVLSQEGVMPAWWCHRSAWVLKACCLSLVRTKVTDAGLPELLGLKSSLKMLQLNKTQVKDAGFPTFLGLENLTILEMADTKIGDATLDQLAGLKGLTMIDVKRTAATDAGLARLQKALPGLRTTDQALAASRARTSAAPTNPPPASPASQP